MHYEKRRLFVGIHLTPFLRKRLNQEVATWGKDVLIPTNEENFHVTLHHLGFVLEDQIPELCQLLAEAASTIAPFDVTLKDIEVVESLENPKFIWLSGEPSEPLRQLHQAVEKALGVFATERKSFRPHVTMAQIKKAKWLRAQAAGTGLPKVKMCLNVNDPVDTITLFETTVREGKRLYDPLASFPLGSEYE
jgi:2'-5' RNA ligase